MIKWVYSFGDGITEGSAALRNLLGGKGANLAEMCLLDLPVPPGFTITTELCNYYYNNNSNFPIELERQLQEALSKIEDLIAAKLGDETNPLLVSVRSGSRASMPGMMDTILNLGLNDKTVEGLIRKTNNARFAYDSYRRFIQMYADVVLGVDHYIFEEILENKKKLYQINIDAELTAEQLQVIINEYKVKIIEETKQPFPQDVKVQLWGAIKAVLKSWMNQRAITYRNLHDIAEDWGTAVNIQAMVFGNMGATSATGVVFTRNPSNGEDVLYGEYLINAQGEDVVAGIRTPHPISIHAKDSTKSELLSMEESMQQAYKDLSTICKKLEVHYKDMQDIEFTVQENKLWILQTRSGKRTAKSALKIAVDMVNEKIITEHEALNKINPAALDQLLHATLDVNANYEVIAKGLPASPGAAVGVVVFSADEALEMVTKKKQKVILVRSETSPEDIHGMHAAEAILTSRGGMTSHAAVVARGMGKPCICGAGGLLIDHKNKLFSVQNITVKEGDTITVNGSSGEVILGEINMVQPNLSMEFNQIMSWADKVRRLKVRANAETTIDVNTALKFGAEGIGLCRTEHMFFEESRIEVVREMILCETKELRQKALNKLLPMQRDDFIKIFDLMKELPVNIRLLDPPLHEFLPHSEEEINSLAKIMGISSQSVKLRVIQLTETNPMLGHRGCRLGITYPEIYEMQVRAIFEAMTIMNKGSKESPIVEIMVPLVMSGKELSIIKNNIEEIAREIELKEHIKLNYTIGTMIELPRAALKAGEIAENAAFFSFGTNDLTQTTFGISRDDAASFIQDYRDKFILDHDPFVKLDQDSVGELITIAVERARKVKPNIKIGICGEHGGDPTTINFFHDLGLDYISCSPYRVPIARLAAAQAALKEFK